MTMFPSSPDSTCAVPLGLTRGGQQYVWDTNQSSNLLAVGGVASGKTMFLRTIMIHATIHQEWQTFLLDGRTAAEPGLNFNDALNVAGYAAGEKSALLDMIMALRAEVEHRLVNGHDNHVLLLIDDADRILTEVNEETQMFMSQLLFIMKYGRSTGVHVALTMSSFPQNPSIVSVVTVPLLHVLLGRVSDDDRFILFDGFTDTPQRLPLGRQVAKLRDTYVEYQGYSYHLSEAEVYLRALE